MRPAIRYPLIAAATGGAALAATWALAPVGAQAPLAAFAQDAAPSEGAEAELPEVEPMVLGAEDAPVSVIEYASFTCPHCASFHDTVWPAIKRDYVDTGKVRFEYREVFFDRPGLWASLVARCGDGMRFFGIADLLYESQAEWAQGQPAEIAEGLRRVGLTAGLEEAQLDACLSDGALAQALVARFERQAEEDSITSTPSFLVDGELHSNMPEEAFRELLDERLEEDGQEG